MPRKAFTVSEVNALIPVLELVLARIQRQKVLAQEHHERMQILDVLWGDEIHSPQNPDRGEWVHHRETVASALQEIERIIRKEILARGIRFPQGGLEHGLMDFPTTWEGRWVLLCWRLGEPQLQAWHEVNAGYAGRQAITQDQAERMGREDDPTTVDDSMLDF